MKMPLKYILSVSWYQFFYSRHRIPRPFRTMATPLSLPKISSQPTLHSSTLSPVRPPLLPSVLYLFPFSFPPLLHLIHLAASIMTRNLSDLYEEALEHTTAEMMDWETVSTKSTSSSDEMEVVATPPSSSSSSDDGNEVDSIYSESDSDDELPDLIPLPDDIVDADADAQPHHCRRLHVDTVLRYMVVFFCLMHFTPTLKLVEFLLDQYASVVAVSPTIKSAYDSNNSFVNPERFEFVRDRVYDVQEDPESMKFRTEALELQIERLTEERDAAKDYTREVMQDVEHLTEERDAAKDYTREVMQNVDRWEHSLSEITGRKLIKPYVTLNVKPIDMDTALWPAKAWIEQSFRTMEENRGSFAEWAEKRRTFMKEIFTALEKFAGPPWSKDDDESFESAGNAWSEDDDDESFADVLSTSPPLPEGAVWEKCPPEASCFIGDAWTREGGCPEYAQCVRHPAKQVTCGTYRCTFKYNPWRGDKARLPNVQDGVVRSWTMVDVLPMGKLGHDQAASSEGSLISSIRSAFQPLITLNRLASRPFEILESFAPTFFGRILPWIQIGMMFGATFFGRILPWIEIGMMFAQAN
ncbi:hypothetical protein BU16DRAFT_596375 [Lophium mytilinum]|uniref:Uncharacterized protein n=1 Tax=Lophium mytilinum TaxID=390894 RepID=A0A6A6QDK9_9PEZI|nr:hypothetical protein BU16DRAFT_596375 [Lophium mytilinum]